MSIPDPARSSTHPLSSGVRHFMRGLWLALTALLLVIFIFGTGLRFEDLATACDAVRCPPLTLTSGDMAALAKLGMSATGYGLFHVVVEVVTALAITLLAGIIFMRKFDDWMGVLMAFALILFGLNFMVETDTALLKRFPALVPPHDLLTALAIVPFIMIFFLFPNGQFVPRWTKTVALLLATAALVDPLLRVIVGETPSGQFSTIYLVVVLVGLLIGLLAQVYRYRRVSTPTERQQTKWVLFGLSLVLIVIFLWSYFMEIAPLQHPHQRVLFNVPVYGFMAILLLCFPIFVVFSILRYRLWDIDVIIRRTLIYGLLSALLALVYFGSVLLLQQLFRSATGQVSPLAIVLSTLAIAALFAPLRSRIQVIIDRRFYRSKYDAERTLAAFARTARDETDLEVLQTELVQVVGKTIQPKTVTVWLQSQGTDRRSA